MDKNFTGQNLNGRSFRGQDLSGAVEVDEQYGKLLMKVIAWF